MKVYCASRYYVILKFVDIERGYDALETYDARNNWMGIKEIIRDYDNRFFCETAYFAGNSDADIHCMGYIGQIELVDNTIEELYDYNCSQ